MSFHYAADANKESMASWLPCSTIGYPYVQYLKKMNTPLFYNEITGGAWDHLSGTHFKNPQAIYSGTRIKKVGLASWTFLIKAKKASGEARNLEF